MTYTAPLADMRFALREVAGLGRVADLPGYEHATDDTVDAVLEEAAKLAGNGLAPLNREGDKGAPSWKTAWSRTAPGFAGIYKEFVAGGWNSLPFDPEFGGQGMPWLLATTVQEMWQAANMGFGLVPAAEPGRDRRHPPSRLGRAEGHLPGQDDLGRMDRHHEPDRAAGRLRSRRSSRAGRSKAATII